METFVAALGTVVAVFVLLRLERGEQSRGLERVETRLERVDTGLRSEIADLRRETRDGFASVNARIDGVMEALLRHIQEGHPPHHAA